MKKLLAMLLALVMILGVFAACTPQNPAPNSSDVIDTDDDWDDWDDFEDDFSDDFVDDFIEEDVPNANLNPVQLRANNIQMGEDAEFIQAGIIKDKSGKVAANNYRMKNFIKKFRANKDLKVVYFGGDNVGVDGGFTDRFTSWLDGESTGFVSSYEASFPGITSTDAVFRVKHDVIDQKPDLVFLDFAVQDAFEDSAKTRAPIFENIVRRILAETDAALVIISNAAAEVNTYRQNNSNPDPMATAGEYHKAIAEFYGVPFIDFHNATWDVVSLLVDKRPYGQIPVCYWPVFGTSNTDLTDVGHKNLSEMMKALITNIEAEKTTDTAKTLGATTNTATYLYKDNGYMTYDYIDAMDIYLSTSVYDKKLPAHDAGYSMENYKGSISKWSKASDYNGTRQFFQAFRPLLEESTDEVKVSAPLIFNIPEVTKENEAYLHVAYEQTTGGSATIPFSLYRYTCYDKNGKIIGGTGKQVLSPRLWKETPTNWGYDGERIKLKEGTVRVTFEIYARAGYIRVYGIGRTQTMSGKLDPYTVK